MSRELLGDTFDIHGGGEDLQFPHHSCEIAQTEALTHQPMCDCWMHVAFITVGGKRMGKSEGNFTTIKDALAKYSPEAIRLWLLQTHYRKPVDFSDEALEATSKAYEKLSWLSMQQRTALVRDEIRAELRKEVNEITKKFNDALQDDLNTPRALAQVFELLNYAKSVRNFTTAEYQFIDAAYTPMLELLGLQISLEAAKAYDPYIDELIELRNKARVEKNWKESDRLRDELLAQGIILEDKPDGTTTWRRK
jgi:cysteinyl-tRNA synthetase